MILSLSIHLPSPFILISNLRLASQGLRSLNGPMRVAQKFPGEENHICFAVRDVGFGDHRIGDGSDRANDE